MKSMIPTHLFVGHGSCLMCSSLLVWTECEPYKSRSCNLHVYAFYSPQFCVHARIITPCYGNRSSVLYILWLMLCAWKFPFRFMNVGQSKQNWLINLQQAHNVSSITAGWCHTLAELICPSGVTSIVSAQTSKLTVRGMPELRFAFGIECSWKDTDVSVSKTSGRIKQLHVESPLKIKICSHLERRWASHEAGKAHGRINSSCRVWLGCKYLSSCYKFAWCSKQGVGLATPILGLAVSGYDSFERVLGDLRTSVNLKLNLEL